MNKLLKTAGEARGRKENIFREIMVFVK